MRVAVGQLAAGLAVLLVARLAVKWLALLRLLVGLLLGRIVGRLVGRLLVELSVPQDVWRLGVGLAVRQWRLRTRRQRLFLRSAQLSG